MDELAMRYLALGLRIGRHIDGYVDAYTGPAELKEAIDSEAPAPPQELHAEAVSLQDLVEELPDGLGPLSRRRGWLHSQLTAMSAVCRHLAGEEISYVDLVEVLYEVPATPVPDSALLGAHRALDTVLPPGDSLRSRLEEHDELTRVPSNRLLAVLESISRTLRHRTVEDLWLPPVEGIDWVAVHDEPWSAYAYYQGGFRTRIEVNIDLPRSLAIIPYLAAHEGYPGHHTERCTKEALLSGADPGFGETHISCLFAPEAAISEGLADLAREVVMTDQELGAELQELATSFELNLGAGLIEQTVAVARERAPLRSASVNVALKLFHEGESVEQVRAWMADVALMSELRIDHQLRALRSGLWATYEFTYHAALTLLRPWLEAQGQTRGFARLLSEQLTPGILLSELSPERALYPGDLV